MIVCAECGRLVKIIQSKFDFSLACPCGMHRGFDYREFQQIKDMANVQRVYAYDFATESVRPIKESRPWDDEEDAEGVYF